jgi:hypothetical protein
MTLFLWHQTAFITVTVISVTVLGSLFGRLPGLRKAPSSLSGIAERLAWLPAFTIVLGLLGTICRRAEQPKRPPVGFR